ncbi:MAG TPA: YciI family protein [Bacteroidota bacterium]|nr:YciI family protein [Bacteroidota bacterium]
MKTILTGLLAALLTTTAEVFAQANEQTTYDSVLAQRLGADKHGMKKYVMAFLRRGPNRSQDSATAAQLQRAHLENIQRLADEGSLILAGPFLDDGDVRGIYVFDVQSVEEARKLTSTDPAIQAGRLAMELHPWYGSAALLQVNELHKRLVRKNPGQ